MNVSLLTIPRSLRVCWANTAAMLPTPSVHQDSVGREPADWEGQSPLGQVLSSGYTQQYKIIANYPYMGQVTLRLTFSTEGIVFH